MSKNYRINQVEQRVLKHYYWDDDNSFGGGRWVPCQVMEVDDTRFLPVKVCLIDENGNGARGLFGWTSKDRVKLDYE
jgi:hypothetical protein